MPKGIQVNKGRNNDDRKEALFGIKIIWKNLQSGERLTISKPEELLFIEEADRNRTFGKYQNYANVVKISKFKNKPSTNRGIRRPR